MGKTVGRGWKSDGGDAKLSVEFRLDQVLLFTGMSGTEFWTDYSVPPGQFSFLLFSVHGKKDDLSCGKCFRRHQADGGY